MRCLAVCQTDLVIRMLDEVLLPSFDIEFIVESKAVARRLADAGVHVTAADIRRTDTYIRAGLERGLARVRSHTESGAGSQAFGVARFLAAQHAQCPGPCGLDTIANQIIAAAVSVGVPERYAERAVVNGLREGKPAA